MSENETKVPLPNLEAEGTAAAMRRVRPWRPREPRAAARSAADLEAMFDVPVQVSAVLGRAQMDVGELLRIGPGAVLELDRKVGEAIDIYVNNRLVARGEVVLVEEKLGVTMTEIIKAERELNHAPSHRRNAQRPAHPRHQIRDGEGRLGDPGRKHRSGAWPCCARGAAPTS